MRSLGRLLILTILSAVPVLSACTNFTLVENINLGGPGAAGAESDADRDGVSEQEPAACIPKRPEAVTAEFAAHGYLTGKEPDWKHTRQWFGEIGKLPTCAEEPER